MTSFTPVGCRLAPRRRLLAGGLLVTTAVVAGTLSSAPAFAIASTSVSTKSALATQLSSASTSAPTTIQLGASLTDPEPTYETQTIASNTDVTLDLAGHGAELDRIVVEPGAHLTVTDSARADQQYDDQGNLVDGLRVYAGNLAAGSSTAIVLGNTSKLIVSKASIEATGGVRGAGIGSEAGDTTGGGDLDLQAGSTVYATGGNGGAGVGGGKGAKPASVDVTGGTLSAQGGAGGAGIGTGATGVGAIAFSTHAPVPDANGDSHSPSVNAYGGLGGAGIGGGEGQSGGAVTIERDTRVSAEQGSTDPQGAATPTPSAIGAGQGGAGFGSLTVQSGGSLALYNDSIMHVPAPASVTNHGDISLSGKIDGDGSIVNDGSISTGYSADGQDYGYGQTYPDDRIAGGVVVTGHNYLVHLDRNGGTTRQHDSIHVWSNGLDEGSFESPTPAQDGYAVASWNTRADGSGTRSWNVDLDHVGTSAHGEAVPLTLYAQYEQKPFITGTTIPDAALGVAYDQALPVGGTVHSYYLDSEDENGNTLPGLPLGLRLDGDTGHIFGAPTEAGTYTVRYSAYGVTYVGGTITFTVAAAPGIGTSALPGATAGSAYSTRIATSGVGPITVSVASGRLPAGLTLAADGTLSGTPTAAGASAFVVKAQSRFGSTLESLALDVAAAPLVAPAPAPAPAPASPVATTAAPAPAPAPAHAAPTLASVPKATVKFGHHLDLAVAANSTLPVTFSVASGSLPRGLTLNSGSGLITGQPADSGTFTVTIKATSSAGSASTTVTVVVPKVTELIDAAPVPAVRVGSGTVPLKVAGFKKGEHWRIKVDGRTVQTGTMKRAGTLKAAVRIAAGTKDVVHVISISGSRSVKDPAQRAATEVRVTSLAAKKTFTISSTEAHGKVAVAVKHLAAGEKVVVKDGRKVVARGSAAANGTFSFSSASLAKGTHHLTVEGATAKRTGKGTVR